MIESPLHRRPADPRPSSAGIDRALVVGVGRSGRSSAAALLRAGVEVAATDDDAAAPGLDEVRRLGARVAPAGDPAGLLDGVALVVPSPGVAEHAPVLAAALDRGLPVWSDAELAWRLAGPFPLVAVTGTNGKTSVTELTAAMLTASGMTAVVGGNIDPPLTTATAALPGGAVVVAELSSFALRFCHGLAPQAGVLLNVAPDHLDWHRTFAAYTAAKARIWQAQTGSGVAVVNADDPAASALARAHAPGAIATFSGQQAPAVGGVGVVDGALVARRAAGDVELLALTHLTPAAPHHCANVAAAAAAALAAGASADAVAAGARSFVPGRHRLEAVAEAHGVTFVDDSKATNPHAAAAALHSFRAIVWIAGGRAKDVALSSLAGELGAVRHAILIGEAAGELAAVCDDAGVPWTRTSSMPAAVAGAAERALPGDKVLLAPACASFDMFRDYADRGEQFAAAARRVAAVATGSRAEV